MTREFVKYEQALALKELGFDEPCFGYYNIDPQLKTPAFNMVKPFEHEWCLPTPTYSAAFRFFREKHNLMFQIFYLRNGNHAAIIHRTTPEYMDLVDQIRPSSGCVDEVVDCYSYEEAELAAIVKLIEICKEKKS